MLLFFLSKIGTLNFELKTKVIDPWSNEIPDNVLKDS